MDVMTVRPINEEELTAKFGTREERISRQQRRQRQVSFIAANVELWREKYANRFVLIHDECIVGVTAGMDDLSAALDLVSVPRGEVVPWFIHPRGTILMPTLFRVAD
jgi:hypothetical protein